MTGINLASRSDAFIFPSICSSGRASAECGAEIVLCTLRVCVCLCVSALELTCLVSLCVQTKIIQCSAWECVHTLCLECQSAKLYLVSEQEGRCVCCSHWKENMSLSVCSPCGLGARGGLHREKDRVGAFKNPPALLPKLILLYHRPCFINLSNLEVNKL